jgi:hypothetical protein
MTNFVLMLATIALCVGAAEAYLRYSFGDIGHITADEWRKRGASEFMLAWREDPVLGWIIRDNQEFEHVSPYGEFKGIVFTGEHGIRVPSPEFQIPKKQNTERRILFIGDSVTASYEVDYEDTFVALTGAQFLEAGVDAGVINAGIRGYSAGQAWKRLEQLTDAGYEYTDVVYNYSFNDDFENMSILQPERVFGKRGEYLSDGTVEFTGLPDASNPNVKGWQLVGPEGDRIVVPALIKEETEEQQYEREFSEQSLYVFALINVFWSKYFPAEDNAANARFEKRLAKVKSKHSFIRDIDYVQMHNGTKIPTWIHLKLGDNDYPYLLTSELVKGMAAFATERNARFWVAAPHTADKTTAEMLSKIAAKAGAGFIDPRQDGFSAESYDLCGGSLTFEHDGHYNPCAQKRHAEITYRVLSR